MTRRGPQSPRSPDAPPVVATISRETLRRILHDGGISWQTTKTWKTSNDPEFLPKMRRVLDLYDNPPTEARVICVDEFGPLNLLPRKGKAWRPLRRPARQRATYTRTDGVRHMLAALDLATGKMTYRIRTRKRWPQFLDYKKLAAKQLLTVISTVRGDQFLSADNRRDRSRRRRVRSRPLRYRL